MSSWNRLAAVLLPVLTLAGCDPARHDAEHWEMERETIELTQRLKLAEYRMGGGRTGDGGELALIRTKLHDQERMKQDLLRSRSTVTVEIGNLERQLDELARADIQNRRQDAMGRKFDTFTLSDGREFRNVSVSAVEDGGVAIRHEHGAARLSYEELTPAQRDSFGLEEASALAARDKEMREALAYERQIDVELDVLRGKQERTSMEERRREESRASRALLARNSTQDQVRPLAQSATPVGGRSWSSRSWYRSYRPTYRYVYAYPSYPNPFTAGSACRHPGGGAISSFPDFQRRIVNPTPSSN